MRFFYYILYLVLDYSIVRDSISKSGKPLHYCSYGKRNNMVEKLPEGRFKEFARSWAWGSLRNSTINLMIVLEKWVGVKTSVMFHFGGDKSFYEIRRFKRLALPYMQFFIGPYRFQAGWLKCGRWQVQFRTYP